MIHENCPTLLYQTHAQHQLIHPQIMYKYFLDNFVALESTILFYLAFHERDDLVIKQYLYYIVDEYVELGHD